MRGAKQEISQRKADQNNVNHRYFTQIPHLVDDMELTIAGFRLYSHIKRVCGEDEGGLCWESQDRLAEQCRMTKKTVVRAKKELKEKGLIQIKEEVNGGRVRHIISVTDIWNNNQAEYSGVKQVPQSKTGTESGENRYRIRGKQVPNRSKIAPLRITHEEEPHKNNQGRKTNSRRVCKQT
jgi:DNA-binding MarR family transcriptional regulator